MSFHGLIAHFFLVLNNIPLSVYITVYLTIHLLNDILVTWASLVAQRLKPLPSMRETWVRSLGREDALEKEMATHSSILAWRIPWTEEPGGLHTVHRVTKSRTQLSDFTFTFCFHALEKEMATHSSVLAWRIPGTEEPGGLPSMGSHRVGHN